MISVETYGAISIVNAIPCLKGSAMSINLKLKVEIERAKRLEVLSDRETNTDFIKYIIHRMMSMYSIDDKLRVRICSEIPSASGLKSSSAVSTALIEALNKYFQLDLDHLDVLKLSAKLSIEYGVSITGAFDDASACFLGGIVYTDNKEMKIIEKREPDDVDVVIYVPKVSKKLTSQGIENLRVMSSIFEEIFKLALKNPWKALTINGLLVASALGYDTSIIYELLKFNSVIAAGLSGNGPAISIVTYKDQHDDVLNYLKLLDGYVITTKPIPSIREV